MTVTTSRKEARLDPAGTSLGKSIQDALQEARHVTSIANLQKVRARRCAQHPVWHDTH